MNIGKKVSALSLLVLLFLVSGCATHLSKPSAPVKPAEVRLGGYEHVFMKRVSISEKFAESGANQKALRKIDEVLYTNLQMVFPKMERFSVGKEKVSGSVLVIEPHIKEIKFISGGARFFAGALAGSSAVLMDAKFVDAKKNKVLADPEFYRSANAWAGGFTIGSTDNKMLEEIAKDVVNYANLNR